MVRPLFGYLAVFNLFAGIQGFFLALELTGRKSGNPMANRMLALFVFAFSVAILGTVLGASGWYEKLPHFIRIGDPLVFLFGPTLYLYIVAHRNRYWHSLLLVHFVPFFLYLLYLLPFYLLPGASKVALVSSGKLFNDPTVYFINVVKLVLTLAYIVAGMFLLRYHRREVQNNFSELKMRSLGWLYWLSGGLLVVWVVAFFGDFSAWFGFLSGMEANVTIAFVMSLVIYTMGYRGLRQQEIGSEAETGYASGKSHSIVRILTGFGDTNPDAQSGSNVRSEKHLATLLKVMETRKPYLKTDLTIRDLSRESGIPVYLLSKLLNEKLNENFYEFINRHRIEEVKKMLTAPENAHYTTLAIAFECGFQSKSTFNDAFKRFTGQTPSAFKKTRSSSSPA